MRGRHTTKPHALLVTYDALGTITTKELRDAILADIGALEDLYHVRYVTGVHLRLPVTNQYGDSLRVIHPNGGHDVFRIDTHHYRPACLDYQL